MYERLIQKLINRDVGATLCTASFQETSANVGDTIHANFTWTGALKKVGELHYAVMFIINPSGVSKKTSFEFNNATGSKTLEYVMDVAGTWTCKIQVWQGFMFIYATDTVSVTEPPPPNGEETLTEAVTCRWVKGFRDHGSKVTQFDIDETVYAYAEIALHGQDAYGKIMKHEWWYKGVKRWEWQSICSSHYTNNWSTWTWWAIGKVHGAGTGYIKIFFDGREMGKTNDFTIASVTVPTAVIDKPSDGATVTSPVHFEGHGEPTETFLQLMWYDGNTLIHYDRNASSSSFDYDLSPGVHNIYFIVLSETSGWSEYAGITITVVVAEGDAYIVSISKPSSFTPGVEFHIKPKVRNDGGSDTLFMGLTDTDTGKVLKDPDIYTFYTSKGTRWEQDWVVTLVQTTDFHGRVDVGHVG